MRESESPSGECKQTDVLAVNTTPLFAGVRMTGGSGATATDDAKLLRKSAKGILTGTELISIGLEPYQAQSVLAY